MAKIDVSLVTPERVVWTGQATFVMARGSEGEVGILPGHAPLLLELGIGILRIEDEGTVTRAAVHGGFLHVVGAEDSTRADILAESAELENEVDAERAARAKEAAERRMAESDDPEARGALARAETRLRIRT
ncbi:MAG TPA: ATP synthase F1 subunit epsilon [Actinomycetota bacterium]|jgi:F-type H+-transporting ATPase subunit epsilon